MRRNEKSINFLSSGIFFFHYSHLAVNLFAASQRDRDRQRLIVDWQFFFIATFVSIIIIIGWSLLSTAPMKTKAKKAKYVSAVEPLQEGEEVTDTTGKKWKLVKQLSCSPTELIYEGQTQCMTSGKINVQCSSLLYYPSRVKMIFTQPSHLLLQEETRN